MSVEKAAFVVSLVAAIAAVVAAIHARTSASAAERSASAAERHAHVEETTLALELERLGAARESQLEAAAPHITGGRWGLSSSGRLEGLVVNRGPGLARVERVELESSQGRHEGIWDARDATVASKEAFAVAFVCGSLDQGEQPLVHVTFRDVASDAQLIASIRLRRAGASVLEKAAWESTVTWVKRL